MTLFELEVTLFASVRALSGVLCTHRSLPGAVTAIFEVYVAISRIIFLLLHTNAM